MLKRRAPSLTSLPERPKGMNDESKKLVIEGDVSFEEVGIAADLLRKHGIEVDLEDGALAKEANFMPTPDILDAAASLAAVFGFFLSAWQAWRSGHSLRKLSKKHQASLENDLESFGAVGFEVENIDESYDDYSKRVERISVTLRDVPGQQTITIGIKNGNHVNVTRKKETELIRQGG